MIDYPTARRIAGMLAALGEPTRMMILHQLVDGPQHVGKLADTLGVPMVNMSHHLGVMRQAGLLEDHKDGRRVVYSLRSEVYTPGGDAGTVGSIQIEHFRVSIRGTPPTDGKAKAKPAKKTTRKA